MDSKALSVRATLSFLAAILLLANQRLHAQIVNGSFEDGASGWSFTGGLSILGPPALPAVGVDGSHCAGIGGGDIPDSTLFQTFPVIPLTYYVLSLATAAGGDNFPDRVGSVWVEVIAPDNSVLASQSFTNISPGALVGTNGFTRHTIAFSTPGGVSSVTLRITDTSPNGGIAVDPLIDGVAVAKQATENLVTNGSFELPSLPLGANHVVPANELFPWQTEESAFLIWASDLPNELAADGRQHVEVVSIWQTAPTIAGEDYRLRFHHSARPGVDSTLNVEINGQVIRTFAENGAAMTGFNWQRFGTNFTAASNATTIRFNGVGAAGNAHIDNVVLERLPLRSDIRVERVEICWESVSTKVYQVEYKSTLTTNLWADLLPPIQGNGTTNCVLDSVPAGEPQRYYRVVTVP